MQEDLAGLNPQEAIGEVVNNENEYEGLPELVQADNYTGAILNPEVYHSHVAKNPTGFLNILTNPVYAVKSLALSVADPSLVTRLNITGGNNSNEKKKVILVMSCLILLILNKKK